MRHLFALLVLFAVLVVSASVVLAADKAADTRPVPKVAHLTTAQLHSLSTVPTRDRQIAAIRKGPAAMKTLFNTLGGASAIVANAAGGAGGGAGGGADASDPMAAWKTGVVLTPFATRWAQGSGGGSASFFTNSAMVGLTPLPTADRPVLSLFPSSDTDVIAVGFTTPAPGGYMVTFNLWAPGGLQFQVMPAEGGQLLDLPLVGDQPSLAASTQLTALVQVSGKSKGQTEMHLRAPAGSMPLVWQWTSVTIRKL